MILPYFFGKIEKGKLKIEDKERFNRYIQKFEDKEIQLTLGLKKKERSNDQNSYYWSVIIRILSDELGIMDEQTHEMLKYKFLPAFVMAGAIRLRVGRSTKYLSTTEFDEYCEKIRIWAQTDLDTTIPKPNEVLEDGKLII